MNVAGASDVLNEGYVTYSNEAKQRLVHVKAETLERFGAVSEETAREMAAGAAKAAGSDVAISATGIAGPGGGTKEKPVGLVYIGCCVGEEIRVKECRFSGTRLENRLQTVETACLLYTSIRSSFGCRISTIRPFAICFLRSIQKFGAVIGLGLLDSVKYISGREALADKTSRFCPAGVLTVKRSSSASGLSLIHI